MILLHLIFLYLLQIIVFSVLVVSSELELPFGVFPVTDEYITRHSVRNIPAKTRGNRGFLPCKKVRGGVAIYDSQVERDFYLLLAHSPLVKWFQHQPHKIVFKNSAGNTKKYTPDVKIEFVNGLRFLVEIKDEITEEMKLENEDKWNAADKWARNRSMNFAIFTAEDIRTARLFNVWFTLGSSKVRENDKYMQKLRTLLSIHGMKGRKYNDLCREVEKAFNVPIAKAAQVICYAIYHGLVVLEDFSTKILTRNSIIRNKHGEERPFLSLIDEMDWNTFDVSEKTRESDFYSFEEESGFEESTFFGKKIPNVLKVGRIPDKCRDEVYKKYFIVDDFLDQPSDLRTTQWREDFINAKKESFDIEFSETSLYRWISGYKNKGLEGLRPDYGKRGKKKEFDTRTFDLMEKAKEYYLKPRVTLSEAHEQLKKLCKKAKPLISRVPSESALKKYIGQRTTYVERFYRRKGKKAYKALFNPSFASFQGAIMPMQVLQLDNTGFDIFPVDT
ncbi:MAG: TnsA endonuclease N-terminal domain-containing protein, partial [Candidatus Odinarchaeota archaeon]